MGNPIPPNIIRVAIQHCKPYKSRIPGWYKLPVKVEKPALQKADTAWKIAKNILFGIREGERYPDLPPQDPGSDSFHDNRREKCVEKSSENIIHRFLAQDIF